MYFNNCGNSSINKTFIIEGGGGDSPVISACTAVYTDMVISCTGDTVSFENIYVDGSVSGDTFYGDGSNLTGFSWSGNTSGDCIDDIYVSNIYGCSPVTIHNGLVLNSDTEPSSDNVRVIGTPLKRFREVNTYSGTSTYWIATTSVTTPALELGVDTSGNTRQITANNSVVQNDILIGGSY
jgi:hypothetical protein